jgi:hypothetical protein
LRGEGELDKFLVPLSLNGRGARGEGLRNFHVTSVKRQKNLQCVLLISDPKGKHTISIEH